MPLHRSIPSPITVSLAEGYGRPSATMRIRCVFNGEGWSMFDGKTLTMHPATSRDLGETHSALVVQEMTVPAEKWTASWQTRAKGTMRRNDAPNAWEQSAWHVFDLLDRDRFRYFMLKGPDERNGLPHGGWEIGERDPKWKRAPGTDGPHDLGNDGQMYLYTGMFGAPIALDEWRMVNIDRFGSGGIMLRVPTLGFNQPYALDLAYSDYPSPTHTQIGVYTEDCAIEVNGMATRTA